MLTMFANNQTLVSDATGANNMYTDSVAIGDNNQAMAITSVSSIFNGGGLHWIMQVSNDGINWLTQGPASALIPAPGVTMQAAMPVSAVFARLKVTLDVPGAAGPSAATFQIQVNFSRS